MPYYDDKALIAAFADAVIIALRQKHVTLRPLYHCGAVGGDDAAQMHMVALWHGGWRVGSVSLWRGACQAIINEGQPFFFNIADPNSIDTVADAFNAEFHLFHSAARRRPCQ